MELEDLANTLRHAGLRVTATRLAVMQALARRPHADTEAVIGLVRAELGSVSPQTVYNILSTLVGAELVRRVEPAGSPALHELRVGDNHHHVVCRRCGATDDIDCAVGPRPCLTPSQTHGYLLDEAEVTFWGLCPSCQRTSAAGASAAGARGAGARGAGASRGNIRHTSAKGART